MGKKSKKRPRHGIGGLEEEDDGPQLPPPPAARAAAGSSSSSVGPLKQPAAPQLALRRGPPVAETSGALRGAVPNDEWQTTRRTWEAIAPHFAAFKCRRVWMPFYYDGACAKHLRSLGFADVVHTDEDFFERVCDAKFMASIDLIWDNPPYTTPDTKERVLRALAACGKPFALLLPISILHVAFVRDIVDMDHVQAIVPRRAWVKKHDDKELPFKYLCWFCSKAELTRDLIFVDDGDGEE